MAIFNVTNDKVVVGNSDFLVLSTISTNEYWTPYNVITSEGTLTWRITGDIEEQIFIGNNPTIDLRLNTKVVDMYIDNPSLITGFTMFNNQEITNFDLSTLVNATSIYVDSNELDEIDISNNLALTSFGCEYNNLSELDISNNILLDTIQFGNNSITSLSIALNTNLIWISGDNNNLSTDSVDQIYIDLDSHGLSNGYINLHAKRSSASNNAVLSLEAKGWGIIN